MFFVNNRSSTNATSEIKQFFRSPTDGAQKLFKGITERGFNLNNVTGNIFFQAAPKPEQYSMKDICKLVFPGQGVLIKQALASDIIDILDVNRESRTTYVLSEKIMSLLLPRIRTLSDTVRIRNDYLFPFLWLVYQNFNSIFPETLAPDNKRPVERATLLNQQLINWSDQHQGHNVDVGNHRDGVGTAAEKSPRNNTADDQQSIEDDNSGESTDQEEQLKIAARSKVNSRKKEKKKKTPKSTKKAAKEK